MSAPADITNSCSLTVPTLPFVHRLAHNDIGAQGASALAAVLKETKISNLECAAAPKCSLLCQRPLNGSPPASGPHPGSLIGNNLGPEAGAALAEGLKGNSTLQSLE